MTPSFDDLLRSLREDIQNQNAKHYLTLCDFFLRFYPHDGFDDKCSAIINLWQAHPEIHSEVSSLALSVIPEIYTSESFQKTPGLEWLQVYIFLSQEVIVHSTSKGFVRDNGNPFDISEISFPYPRDYGHNVDSAPKLLSPNTQVIVNRMYDLYEIWRTVEYAYATNFITDVRDFCISYLGYEYDGDEQWPHFLKEWQGIPVPFKRLFVSRAAAAFHSAYNSEKLFNTPGTSYFLALAGILHGWPVVAKTPYTLYYADGAKETFGDIRFPDL